MNESITNMRAHWTAMYAWKWLVPFVCVITLRLGCVCYPSAEEQPRALPPLQHRVSALTQIVGYVGSCTAEIRRPPDSSLTFLSHQSISALHLDVGRNTNGSSRACSCWPACLLLWMWPRRPISEGWSGSAGRGTWSPASGRSRAGCRLAWAVSWTLTSCSGTKSWPAGERSVHIISLVKASYVSEKLRVNTC